MSLKEELQTVDGVGEATADKIMAVVDKHSDSSADVDRAIRALERNRVDVALDYLQAD